MKLFEFPPHTALLEGLLQCRNILAYLFLLAPVLAVALFGFINWTNWPRIKHFLFGDSQREAGFSVLSFFFERVQGHVEHKHIKTPVDSIQAFRDIFSQLLDDVHSRNKELRIVIIIDNIDRIPADQARDFWSTMQTFFSDGGGLRRPQTRKYWLVAPFSIEAMSFIFQDSIPLTDAGSDTQTGARATAKAYIDRTFGLAFYVPPLILTNWRKYLLAKLRESFPEHNESDLIAVRDVFDFARSGLSITPREMKLFVNSLVVVYRQRGDEITLIVMAIYILHRDKIVGAVISDELIPARELRLIEEVDWRIPIVALHFGVSPEEATQLLLQEPMLTALREGSKENLKELEGRPGFLDVLRRVTVSELESPGAEYGTMLVQMAATIGGLDGAAKPALTGVWTDIRGRLRRVKVWDGLQASSAQGIAAALNHTSDLEKGTLRQAMAASLSKAVIAEPEGDFQKVNAAASNWLRAAKAVADAMEVQQAKKNGLPGGVKLKLELLQQLAELDAPDNIKAAFRLDVSPEGLSKAFAAEITAGRFPRTQVPLVSLLSKTMKTSLQWSPIVSTCAERLRVPDIGANETKSLIGLLLAASAIDKFADALNTLKDLSIQGHLSNLFQQHQSAPDVRAKVITAVILANPAFDRPNQVGQSQAGDHAFNELSSAQSFDPGQIQSVAQVIKSIDAGSMLFEAGARNPKIARLAAAIIGDLTRSSYQFAIEHQTAIEQRRFLEAQATLNPITAFLAKLTNPTDILSLLTAQPFEVDRAQFYRAALGIASGDQGSSYLAYLKEGLLVLDKGQWEQSLNADNGPYFELLELAGDLRKKEEDFELSTPARDAALDRIRKAGTGKPVPSHEIRKRLSNLLQLLPNGLRSLLIRDVIDDIVGHTDPKQITQLIETAGDQLSFEEETDPDRIVRRIFSPIVGNPTERSAAWMATIVGRELQLFRQLPEETKQEFGWRLRTALQNKDVIGPAVTEALTNTAGLLNISLSPGDEDNSGDTAHKD
jgi:hypothetical protein